jgi:alcohol dehydrogenase YqhD (iron-dependent ADH family)
MVFILKCTSLLHQNVNYITKFYNIDQRSEDKQIAAAIEFFSRYFPSPAASGVWIQTLKLGLSLVFMGKSGNMTK